MLNFILIIVRMGQNCSIQSKNYPTYSFFYHQFSSSQNYCDAYSYFNKFISITCWNPEFKIPCKATEMSLRGDKLIPV